MKRRIVGFHREDEKDWVAELVCGHGHPVRHRPPYINRPWVRSEAGRRARIGTELNCMRCERLEWPEGLEEVRRSPELDRDAIPPALLEEHRADEPGTWVRVEVLEGRVRLVLGPPLGRELALGPGESGLVPPDVPYRLALPESGSVRLRLSLHRAPWVRTAEEEGPRRTRRRSPEPA